MDQDLLPEPLFSSNSRRALRRHRTVGHHRKRANARNAMRCRATKAARQAQENPRLHSAAASVWRRLKTAS